MKAKKIFLLSGVIFLILAVADVQAGKRVVVKNSRRFAYNHNAKKAKVKVKHNTPFVKSLRFLPNGAIAIKHKGVRFHYYGGKYYRHYAGKYISVAPSIGIRIRVLPKGHISFVINNRAYFYHDGVYYTKRRLGRVYEVIDAPIGAVIHYLPLSAERIRINGRHFFECNLTIYKKIRSSYGHSYQVVGHLESYGNRY